MRTLAVSLVATCSSDSEGRYQLSMTLIQQTISCPWQPRLRKALPAGYNSSHGSLSGNGSKPAQLGTRTLLSEVRSLLNTTPQQQAAYRMGLFQAVYSHVAGHTAAAPMPGIQLGQFVQGGYCWRLSLSAAPFRHTSASHVANAPTKTAGAAARVMTAQAVGQAGTEWQQQQQLEPQQGGQQMVLSIVCQPAWANNLDVSAAAMMLPAGTDATAAAAVVVSEAAESAAAKLVDCSCGQCSAPTPPLGIDLAGKCEVCQCLCSVAMHRAAATRARHLGEAAATSHCAGGSSTTTSTTNCSSSQRSCWTAAQDVVVGVNVVAAPSAAMLQDLVSANTTRAPAEAFVPCKLCWCDAAGAAWGLLPLDVTAIGSSRSGNLVARWDCGMAELPIGAVQLAGGVDGVGGGGGGVGGGAGQGDEGAGGGGGLVVGWQPELWSRLAYTGELHWHISLRQLSD